MVAVILGASTIFVIFVVGLQHLAMVRARGQTAYQQFDDLESIRDRLQDADMYDEDPILYYV